MVRGTERDIGASESESESVFGDGGTRICVVFAIDDVDEGLIWDIAPVRDVREAEEDRRELGIGVRGEVGANTEDRPRPLRV